jgi:hypothetical protein
MYTAPAEGDTVADLLAAIAADPTFELSPRSCPELNLR